MEAEKNVEAGRNAKTEQDMKTERNVKTKQNMKTGQNLEKIGQAVFYTALVLEMLFVLLDKSDYIIPSETWCFRFTFFLFAVKIICTKYTKKEWAVMVLFGILGVVSYFFSGREEMVRVVAFAAACKNVDIKTVLKVTFFETLLGCAVIILLALTGVYGTVSVTGFFRGGGVEETRFCLGMGHPNALHCMFFVLLVLGMAIYSDWLKWYGYVLLFLLNLGVYFLTDSRTGMLSAAAAVMLAVFLRYAKRLRDKKAVYVLGIVFLLACVLLTLLISIYGVRIPILRQIDIRINGRFQWGKSEGGMQYWSLFSNPENQNYMDMGYMKLFYWYGIVPAVLYIGAVCLLIWECYKRKAYGAFLVTMMFSAYTLIEAHAVSVFLGRNYILLFMGAMWYTVLNGENGGMEEETYAEHQT